MHATRRSDVSDSGSGLAEQVDAEEARRLIAGGEVRVIDVRSAEEFAEKRINGSVRVDPDDLGGEVGEDDVGREAVLVICGDGSRSAEVAERLRSEGNEATSIDGGFGAWTSDGLPTAPRSDEEYEGPELKQPGVADSSEDEEEDQEGTEDGERPSDSRRDVSEHPVDAERAEQGG